MALSNAERQRRYRERLKERLRQDRDPATAGDRLVARLRSAYHAAALAEIERILERARKRAPRAADALTPDQRQALVSDLETWLNALRTGDALTDAAMLRIMARAGKEAASSMMHAYGLEQLAAGWTEGDAPREAKATASGTA